MFLNGLLAHGQQFPLSGEHQINRPLLPKEPQGGPLVGQQEKSIRFIAYLLGLQQPVYGINNIERGLLDGVEEPYQTLSFLSETLLCDMGNAEL